MPLDPDQRAAVDAVGEVKGRLVDFALTPPFQKHLRRLVRQLGQTLALDNAYDIGVYGVEELLFEFRYDDGSTVIDRFIRRRGADDLDREIAPRMLDGYGSFFELLDDVQPPAESFRVRCCLSDLEYRIAPTLPETIGRWSAGEFMTGRIVPVPGTDLWTLSGVHVMSPASARSDMAESTKRQVLSSTRINHRNPEYLRQAQQLTAEAHERFIAAHGTDLVLVPSAELPAFHADAMIGDGADADPHQMSRESLMASIEQSGLMEYREVYVLSHPEVGLGFYPWLPELQRAMTAGASASRADLRVLGEFLQSGEVPSWATLRIVHEHGPAAVEAVQTALAPAFAGRGIDDIVAELPGEKDPRPLLSVMPTICQPAAEPLLGGD